MAFAVKLNNSTYYGEINYAPLAGGDDFNVEILSFGWSEKEDAYREPIIGRCSAFTEHELRTVQELVLQAVQVWRSLEKRPFFLTESPTSHFMGEVIFRDGWALIKDEGNSS